MNYIGDYDYGAVVQIPFNTFDSNDPSESVTVTDLITSDIHIHKGSNLSQRTGVSGISLDIDVDGVAGCHLISIDTSDNDDANFYVPGEDYEVRIEGATVDEGTINPFVGHFSIENRHSASRMVSTMIATLASQISFTLTVGSADNDAYNNCVAIITDRTTGVQKAVARISDYNGGDKTVALAGDPGIFTMAQYDNIAIFAGPLPFLATKEQLADQVYDEAYSGHVAAGSFGKLHADILDDTGTAGVVLANGAITDAKIAAAAFIAAKFGADFLTAAKIADDAIAAEHLKADAVTKIATGVATSLNLLKNSALNNFVFKMRDSTTKAPKDGLTPAGFVSLDGGAYAGVTGAIAEISDGSYRFDAAAADRNGTIVAWRFTAAGADDVDLTMILGT